MTPTARSLKKLRDDGYFADTVERWQRFPDKNKGVCMACHRPHMVQIRKDFLFFADIIAFKPGVGFLAIQATDLTSVSKHVHKIEHMEAVFGFRAAGGRVQIWAWGLKGPAGKRKTYQIRVVELGNISQKGE